jgi:tetratricopeptide (TPR) repeat protein
LAPEGPGTPQADLYALGKVLYEAAFGKDRQEFPALPADVAARHDHARLLELNAILLKACAADRRGRYPNAAAMLAELQFLDAGRSIRRQHLWRMTIKRVATTALLIALASALVAIIDSSRRSRLRLHSITLSSNAEAREAYTRGMILFDSGSGKFDEAAKHFQHATEVDPKFAPAYARLALAHIHAGAPNSNTELLSKARAAANRAIALDPNLPDGHSCLGSAIQLFEFDWDRAEKQLNLAYKLAPDSEDVLYRYATTLVLIGQAKEALRLIEKAQRRESRSVNRLQNAGWIYLNARDYQRAIAKFDEVLTMQPANRQRIWGLRLAAYCGIGDFVKAIEVEREAALLNGGDPGAVNERFDALRQAFEKNGAGSYWKQKLEWAKKNQGQPMPLAALYARVGDRDHALDELRRALRTTPHGLYFKINTDAAFDSLRTDPDFINITEQIPKRPRKESRPALQLFERALGSCRASSHRRGVALGGRALDSRCRPC